MPAPHCCNGSCRYILARPVSCGIFSWGTVYPNYFQKYSWCDILFVKLLKAFQIKKSPYFNTTVHKKGNLEKVACMCCWLESCIIHFVARPKAEMFLVSVRGNACTYRKCLLSLLQSFFSYDFYGKYISTFQSFIRQMSLPKLQLKN